MGARPARVDPPRALADLSDAELYESLKRAVNQKIISGEIPSMLAEVFRRQLWKGVEHPTRGHVGFRSFTEFVQSSPDGLGLNPVIILTIARRAGLPRVESILAKAFARDRGGDQRSEQAHINHDNVILDRPPQGNARSYALRRLAAGHAALHQRVLDQELSPHAAMILAGLRHPTATIRLDALEDALRLLLKHWSRDALRAALGPMIGCPRCGWPHPTIGVAPRVDDA